MTTNEAGGARRWFIALAATSAIGAAGCQLDPGNFIAYQFYDPDRKEIATVHVNEIAGGATIEHWAFNSSPYDPTKGVDTVRSGSDLGDFASFKEKVCRAPVRKYLQVATDERALSCEHPVPPKVSSPADAVLGDGTYEVRQGGAEVGIVFVKNKVEHWAVITDRFRRPDGFQVRPRAALDWPAFAQYACKQYSPRTYWVVTATVGTLCP